MSYTAIERETIIHCDDETKSWSIFTLQPTIITKLKRAGIEPYKVDKDNTHYYKDVDFSQVSFRKKSSKKEMSEEEKKMRAEILKKARQKIMN